MLKKLVFSFVLGLTLFTSLTIGAQGKEKPNKEEPILVAKIDVENQISISDHEAGQANFINQVGVLKADQKTQENVPMSVGSVFWTMAFGLLIFVIRVTARRIK